MRKANLLGLVVACGLLLAVACGPGASPDDGDDDQAGQQTDTGQTPSGSSQQQGASGAAAGDEEAKFGGVLLTPLTTPPPGHIPWEEAVTTAMAPNHLQHNMIVAYQYWGDYAAKDYWNVVGDLAESWEQSTDGLTWTFHFHDGVTWSDGTPFTCADAKWSLDTMRTGEGLRRSPRAVQFKAVSTIECPDDRTMVVRLARPQPAFLEVLAMGPNMVFPKHIAEGNLDAWRENPLHVSTGPFRLQTYLPGENYIFERNPDYFKSPYPYLDGVELPQIATNAVPPALRAGRIHMGGTGSAFGGA
jgi:ABC-type transport system substrate-binding protein